MRRPEVLGRIGRRLLVDRAADPEVASTLLPAGFAPRLLDGAAVVGMCLIRLTELRPAGLPARLGTSMEAVAHRISVWGPGRNGPIPGVYVPRRDTSSRLAVMAGGSVWPGVHGRARFDVEECRERLAITASWSGGGVAVDASLVPGDPSGQVLAHPAVVSDFHRDEVTAWSPDRTGRRLEAADLAVAGWAARSVALRAAGSSYLDDVARFRPGSSSLLGALLMEHLDVTWRPGVAT